MDADLEMAANLVARQFELVPWLAEHYVPTELTFRLLPVEMLEVIQSSPDYVAL